MRLSFYVNVIQLPITIEKFLQIGLRLGIDVSGQFMEEDEKG
jgi:hypothetical protein